MEPFEKEINTHTDAEHQYGKYPPTPYPCSKTLAMSGGAKCPLTDDITPTILHFCPAWPKL